MSSSEVTEHMPRMIRVAAVVAVVTAVSVVGPFGSPRASASIAVSQTWQVTLPDQGGATVFSSPNLANLPGGPSVVVGDRAGRVYALSLASGASVPGWPYNTGGVAVDTTPSVAQAAGSPYDDVYVGLGQIGVSSPGGYSAITPQATQLWHVAVANQAGAPVNSGLAVGDLEGSTDVVGDSLGQWESAMNAQTGSVLAGFPWFQADSSFSTPALADLYGDGRTEIVEGGDSTAGNAYGVQYQNGGHLRVLSPTGNSGTGAPAGGLLCQYNTDQNVMSSPAVGAFLGGNTTGIAFGTGTYYNGASTSDDVIAVDTNCNLQWTAKLDGFTSSSPALADVMGNGQLQVVEGTTNQAGGGSVWVLNGATGAALWHQPTSGMVIGSVVTADLTGGGYQDVIVPTTAGVQIFDGRSGELVTTIGQGMAFQNSPLVTHDPNGTIGITIAGYNGTFTGVVTHYEVSGSSGALADEYGAWPMFHHDPQLTGNSTASPSHVDEFIPDGAFGHTWNAYDQTVDASGPAIVGRPGVVADPGLSTVHAYAQTESGDLVEYVNDDAGGHLWNSYDLSVYAGGGGAVGGTPNAIYNGLIHVYVRAASGDLMEYVNDGADGHLWNAYDLTVYAGGGWIEGTPTVVYDGLVHVYVRGANNDLVEYVNDDAGGRLWNAYDLSVYAGGGGWVGGDPGATYTGLVHVYVESISGHLEEYVNDGADGHLWNAYDLTVYAGGGAPVSGTPAPIYTGPVHVYVRSATGHLMEYVNDGADGHLWNAYDLTVYAGGGGSMVGTPSPVSTGPVHVYVRATAGHLVEYVNADAGGHLWNAYDLTVYAGGGLPLGGDPGAGVVGGVPHVYAPGG